MLDDALIRQCADPSLPPAIVEAFVSQAGSDDPLSVTVMHGRRLVLTPRPKTPEEALALARDYVGRAVVRVGVTQLPAGLNITTSDALKPKLFDACQNLRQGTALFVGIFRRIVRWYGDPPDAFSIPEILDDAIHAWKTGEFEGENVFLSTGPAPRMDPAPESLDRPSEPQENDLASDHDTPAAPTTDLGAAGIRIDLSPLADD